MSRRRQQVTEVESEYDGRKVGFLLNLFTFYTMFPTAVVKCGCLSHANKDYLLSTN